jgi:DNA polymerase I-like protein with 3'-5' exonuclease and polymerase domains
MEYTVFDIETNGLLDTVSKIHCLSLITIDENFKIVEKRTYTEQIDMIKLFNNNNTFIGHNIIRYDIPVLCKLLNIKKPEHVIDTLGLSWYLFPEDKKHGLKFWGEYFKIPKPVIKDWNNLETEEYIKRCETDVLINKTLFENLYKYLKKLYDKKTLPIINYLNFKLECLRDQEAIKIPLDIPLCQSTLKQLYLLMENKIENLSQSMPEDLGKIIKKKPLKLYQKNNNLSTIGIKWFEELKKKNLPKDTKVIRDPPNPNSIQQLKEWLFRLGWKPTVFKDSPSTKEKVPQISLPFQEGLCPNIKSLYPSFPILKELENLFIIRHRISILESFIEAKNNLYSNASGFTNTLRLKHSKPIVNLPKITKPYGKEIRGCLTVPDDTYTMCGADLSSLEDSTKQHYIYFFDPEYVKEMRTEGYDPHIDIALLSELITHQQAQRYKELKTYKELTKDENDELNLISSLRAIAKNGNFAMTYGAFPKKVSQTINQPLKIAENLYKIYWERNSAIKSIVKSINIKNVNNQKWIRNPVSGFWLYLKNEKDIFSTLNQNTGVYFFDTWIKNIKKRFDNKIIICLQYHDEIMFYCKNEDKEFASNNLKEAIKETNNQIKLNIEINISEAWGKNYAQCH